MDAEAPQKPDIAPILSVVFVGSLGFSIVLPFLIFLVIRFGGNPFVYGIVGATYSAFQLVGAPILGRWSDRFGRRPVLLLSQLGTLGAWVLFLVALQLPIQPLAQIDWPLIGAATVTLPLLLVFAARALDGLTGGNVSVANAYLADITTDQDRSKSFGKMAAAQNVGFVGGPALAGILGGTTLGENVPVALAIAISLVALWIIYTRMPHVAPCGWEDSGDPDSVRKIFGLEMRDCRAEDISQRTDFRAALAIPSVGLILGIQFLVFLAFNFFYVGMPTHAASALGWSVTGVGFFLSFLGLSMALVQGPLLPRLTARFDDKSLIVGGGLLLAASFGLFATGQLWAWIFGAVVLALGNGTLWPSLSARLSKAADADTQGMVQGLSGSLGAIASILGLIAGGFLYGAMGPSLFLVAAAVTVVGWVAAFRLAPGDAA